MPDASPNEGPADALERLSAARAAAQSLRLEVAKAVVGQREVVDEVLLALFCRGHALLVGVPGLAKTLLVSSIARAMELPFSRIQFTPDLMPADITGTEIFEEDRATGKRELRFVKGPIFASAVLADEINRTPPKTQAALLEAMQEGRVTAGGRTMDLPDPFFVLATQNPLEQEGTYPLPEAQLDRFMFMIRVGYPTEADELDVIQRTTSGAKPVVKAALDAEEVRRVQALVREVPVPEHVARYALRLVRATRTPGPGEADARPGRLPRYLRFGAGPRAGQYLLLGAKARAVLEGRTHATAADVDAVAAPVLRHRVGLNFAARSDGVDADALVAELVDAVPVGPAAGPDAASVLR
ncbi:AAA family ATPase [Phycisphaera mikurensis]|uniref:ATPase n=1 Tax=Phycisphaera mikurensis (strain NBRC 102666 / KCTC 22515 / FYK2301M01) TaxID=1142394 RepID=I0IAJ5_PHYMF|nr:MoxR family ATPase [Phycisphaera mikurensis]MBB6441721.1 MoxR-like ATPase [Phycisphaera mikurensis]BAM02283.1 hypothetical protein PSMK_01240 [Phycisphaera mikurensis NBRC 102666]